MPSDNALGSSDRPLPRAARLGADVAGFRAGGVWPARLEQSKKEGLTPLAALRRWIGEPEDPVGGGIAADVQEQELPNSEAVKELAAR